MAIEWGALTPQRVAEWITFERGNPAWGYRSGDASMSARQAEGVAALWNKLSLHKAALLADEVGTGKTVQALGVMAMLWKMKPDARVLVMAPNRDICAHWEDEYTRFVAAHYRQSDGLVRRVGSDDPVHGVHRTASLPELAELVEEEQGHFYCTTIHALSHLLDAGEKKQDDKKDMAKGHAEKIHARIKAALGGDGFDLIVIDEAHYFRNNRGDSQRIAAACAFFGRGEDRLGSRVLLMTATPSHASMDDVSAILDVIAAVPAGSVTPDAALQKYALRRLRRMMGCNGGHDKYSYRSEKLLPADFSDPKAELFFALYQKMLVERQKSGDGKRYLYGYLEGFESFDAGSEHKTIEGKSGEDIDENAHREYNDAPDTDILRRLSAMHAVLGELPAHPKYDKLIKECVAANILDPGTDLHEHKHLVFVRRIASVREIAARINAACDKQMANQIIAAWGMARPKERLQRWQKGKWSRAEFNKLPEVRAARRQNTAQEPPSNEQAFDEHQLVVDDVPPTEDHIIYSQIAQLFVEKPSNEPSTDCANFRARLRRSDSPFFLLLEPASDYRTGGYDYCHRRLSGERERDEYGTAARQARGLPEEHDKALTQVPRAPGEPLLPTLWGLLAARLPDDHQALLEELAGQPAMAESFGHYIRNGFLYASPVIVELYCWYVRFSRGKHPSGAQDRYLAFVRYIESRLAGSLAMTYFKAALETFKLQYRPADEATGGKKDRKDEWRHLIGLTSPAFFASGGVHDRQRLIRGFNSPFYPNVLVSTSVLQEGVDLHLQCRKVHHYGIAWTPGDNEQRVGRVDRLFGKVNMQLQQEGKAELAIYYPYLMRSFDEEQLASFVRQKYAVELRMDACRQGLVQTEIDLRDSIDGWQAYLRTPQGNVDGQPLADPFPFNPAERPATDYRAAPDRD